MSNELTAVETRGRFGVARRALLASVAALAAGGLAKLTAPQQVEAADPNDLVLNANNATTGTTQVSRTSSTSATAFKATNNNGLALEGRSTNSYAVYGESVTGHGVIGVSNGANEGVLGISASGIALRGDSSGSIGIVGYTMTGVGGYFSRNGATGYALRAAGPVLIEGDFSATGMKSAIVPGADGDLRRVFCLESPDSMFEDFGRDKIVNGQGAVRLDPDFRAIIRGDNYEIFLTPLGDCNGLYVSGMDRQGFQVREIGGGTNSVSFSYRVAGKRKDVGDEKRLERVRVTDLPVKPRDSNTIREDIRNRTR